MALLNGSAGFSKVDVMDHMKDTGVLDVTNESRGSAQQSGLWKQQLCHPSHASSQQDSASHVPSEDTDTGRRTGAAFCGAISVRSESYGR
ncbi:hypothetical protein H6P81_005654 [Aristolochia fimbriata]|uniref:Uncharacterized protein n=1 Tax=Aristolochia fimbriata TaxID=158543 RepID=A0AAV7EV26_ARIFI|nr:hypothetical protein H6P81_005654 [Aristolochia fimbriata]